MHSAARCGGLSARHLPLVHGVIGDAVDADFAVAPGLRAGPLDAPIEILRLARRPHVEMAGRAAGAARVDAHAGIAVRHPFLRIDQFPVLIFVARPLQHLGRGLGQARPIALVAFLERQALGVWPVAENDRMLPRSHRPEHIGAQHHAVVHRDRRVPIDLHAVSAATRLVHVSPIQVSIRRRRQEGRSACLSASSAHSRRSRPRSGRAGG